MKKITLKDLQVRIDELERQVRDLQARPVYVPVFPPSEYHPYAGPYTPFVGPSISSIPNYPLNPSITTWTTVSNPKLPVMNGTIQTFNSQEGQNK
jgi:hypothetical protein